MKQNLLFFILSIFLITPSINAQEAQYLNGKAYLKQADNWYLLNQETQKLVEVLNGEITLKINTVKDSLPLYTLSENYNLTLKRKAITGWYDFTITSANYTNLISYCASLQALSFVDEVDVATPIDFLVNPNDSAYFDAQTYLYYQWNLRNAKVDLAWDKTKGDNNVVIGMIDSGLDWFHEDYAQGTPTIGNSNIWYNPGEDMWTDINDPTTGNGIDDDGNGYIDDLLGWNMIDGNNNISDNAAHHGTGVGSIMSARTNNYAGIAGVAGGWGNSAGCQLMTIKVLNNSTGDFAMSTILDDAIFYAAQNEVAIINISLGTLSNHVAISAALEYATQKKGCFIVAASGNNQFSATIPVVFPANDPNVFSVANSNKNDQTEKTHTGPNLDLAAPGHAVPKIKANNSYENNTGSSLSSPLVAGTAALMLSLNECLPNNEIANILRATADKTGGFDYNYDPLKPGHALRMGYGRLNALEAVTVAEAMRVNESDLYMKDRDNDFGYANSYPFAYYFDNSPDIWVRDLADGYTNTVHQSPEYSSLMPAHVYVRVRNKGCSTTSGTERLKLYWSKASSNASWPQNWDGSQPQTGDEIGNVVIPSLDAGEDTVLHFSWVIIPEVGENEWGTCLLAHIEDDNDATIIHPGFLANDVYVNNNVAMRNLTVVNVKSGKTYTGVNGITYPPGRHTYIGNSEAEGYENIPIDVYFEVPAELSGVSVVEAAEVTIYLDDLGWEIFLQAPFDEHEGVEIIEEKMLRITTPIARLNNMEFPSETRSEIYVGFNFLTDEIDEKTVYNYHVAQRLPLVENKLIGAMHFSVNTEVREPFQADAGNDIYLQQNETAYPTAKNINEPATYKWYNTKDSLVYEGRNPAFKMDTTETYKLEVVADKDKFKDYDDVRILVNPYAIKRVSPNPTGGNLLVEYDAEEATTAYLMVFPTSNPANSSNFSISTSNTSVTLNLSALNTGAYVLLLVCDGNIVASENFVKN